MADIFIVTQLNDESRSSIFELGSIQLPKMTIQKTITDKTPNDDQKSKRKQKTVNHRTNVESRSSSILERKVGNFQDVGWRRMEKISWIDEISKEEVLQRVQESRGIIGTIQQWTEHTTLRYRNLLCDTFEGRRRLQEEGSGCVCLATSPTTRIMTR